MDIENNLTKIKEKIDSDSEKEAEKKVLQKFLLDNLLDNFNCKSLEEAIEYRKELEISKKSLRTEIETGIINLKQELDI